VAWLVQNQALLSACVSLLGILSGVLAVTWYVVIIYEKLFKSKDLPGPPT
jgi:hypothetical protein